MTSLPTHELLLGDEYWSNPRTMPKIPASAFVLDGLATINWVAEFGGDHIDKLYGQVTDGNIANPVYRGDPLPPMARGQGLLRVVEDVRISPMRQSALARLVRRGQTNHKPERFDDIAAEMLEDKLYAGESARMVAQIEDTDDMTGIRRRVYYLTGSLSGNQLEGVSSELLHVSGVANHVLPPLRVNEAYQRNRSGSALSKIVAAHVLVAGGSRRSVRRPMLPVSPRLIPLPSL
jgi:hypothetical protein